VTALAIMVYQVLALPIVGVAILYILLFRRDEASERFGGRTAGNASPPPGTIWIHAASLGEYEAARPLVDAVTRSGNADRLLVSCTNSIARRRFLESVPFGARVRIAPLDFWPFVARGIAIEKPSELIFLETEIWPAWIVAAFVRSVPVAIVSARISRRSFGRYRLLRPLLRPVLGRVRVIGCRTEEDRRRWIEIGAPAERCHVWGNTKYDAGRARPDLGSLPPDGSLPFVWIAGSVRRGEEGILQAFHRIQRDAKRSIRLILVPRHIRDVGGWEDACIQMKIACRRLSLAGLDTGPPIPPAADNLRTAIRSTEPNMAPVIIVDRVGVLARLYAVADAAFVGGTWIPLGGHSLFEPAREGIPVLFGESTEGVRDIAEALVGSGGGFQVVDPEALARRIMHLMGDPDALAQAGRAARRTAESVASARDRTYHGLRQAGFLAEPASTRASGNRG
jgi:3-deoxy-D-manno-octulosonic-acid transferase